MKSTIGLTLITIFAIGCQTSKIENVEVNQSKLEAAETPKVQNSELTDEQQKKLEETLPDEAIEILENANEFILESGDGSPDFTPVGRLKIKDKSVVNKLIKAIYLDVRNQNWRAACFSPQHSLKAKFNDKSLRLLICYECFYLKGYVSDKKFIRGFDSKFSKDIFDQILEKAKRVNSK